MKYIIPLLLFALSVSGQTLTIQGKTINSKGLPLANIKILINNSNTTTSIFSDSLGFYAIQLKKGTTTFFIDETEYKKIELTKNIIENETLDFILEHKTKELDEVVVQSASKKGLTTTESGILTLNPKKLSYIPSLTGTTDVIKLLQLTPGVQNSGDANGYLYIRGSNPGNSFTLYNNVPVYGTAHLLGIFPYYNADHIESVVFDKSSLNAKFGSNLGATISVTPTSKIPSNFSVTGNVGLLSSQLTLATPIKKKLGIVTSFRKTYIDQLIAPLLSKTEENSDVKSSKYHFQDGNITLIYQPKENITFQLDSFFSNDVFDINEEKISLTGNLKWKNFIITPSLRYQVSDNTKIESTVFFTRYANVLDLLQNDMNLSVASYIEDIGTKHTIIFKIKDFDFESGVQYTNHKVAPQKITIQNLTQDNQASNANNTNANEFNVFNTVSYKFSDKITTKLGLRLNYLTSVNNYKKLNLDPRISINYALSNNLNTFVTYTHKNQYLNLITTSRVGIPTDFWVSASNEIPSNSSNEFSIGFNYTYKNKFNLTSSLFYNNLKNLIEYPYGLSQFNQISKLEDDITTGNGRAYGFEFMLKKEMGRLKGWISYTLSWAYRNFEDINQGEDFYAKFDRRHNFSLVAHYEFNPKWSLGFTQLYSSGNRFTSPSSWYIINNQPVKEYGEYNNSQMPNYIRTDFSVNYWFFKTSKKESGLSFSIFNTLNINNPIYINLVVNQDEENTIRVETKYKTLYRILPSINWHFKF
ncbi:MAG: TonB-dependent receptor plug domain-containing protein [Limnohabitans sp.]|nr:TonB-dependent receptor plug domain-containing protein [Limnohabitans sp.]